MPNKFNRYAKLTIEAVTGEMIEIGDPYTIEFNVSRHRMSSANSASVTIYNLSNESRKKLFKDYYNINVYRFFQLRAGYGKPLGNIFKKFDTPLLTREAGSFSKSFETPLLKSLVSESENLTPVIFEGDVAQCYSERRGVDMLTHIETYDGGFALGNSEVNISVGKNVAYRQVIRDLMLTMPGITVGAIGNFEGELKRGNSFTGSPVRILDQITNNNFYIEFQKAYAIKASEYIAGVIPTVDVSSGLLGTPRRYKDLIELTMLFEPNIVLDQLVDIKSITAENLNGRFKVVGIEHSGMVSPVANGNATTKITLHDGSRSTEVRKNAT